MAGYVLENQHMRVTWSKKHVLVSFGKVGDIAPYAGYIFKAFGAAKCTKN